MFDDLAQYFQDKDKDWEARCQRCGGCCGSFDDPCKHLREDNPGKYHCDIYENRFGLRESLKGEKFYCVHITKLLNTHWKNDHMCAYRKRL